MARFMKRGSVKTIRAQTNVAAKATTKRRQGVTEFFLPAHRVRSERGTRVPLFRTREETRFRRCSGRRAAAHPAKGRADRKSTRLNSSHVSISYAVFCLKKKNITNNNSDLINMC